MAGHSKSSNIKHRKNAQDAKRSRLFSKLTRDITVAARENPDASQNPRLRLAKERALASNLKKETIEKAIQKVTHANLLLMEAIRYEGYGPVGIPMLVDTFTDNRHRTASNVRYVLNRQGGHLGTTGSVAWLFVQKGMIRLSRAVKTESELMELALAVGADDILFSQTQRFLPKLISQKEDLALVVKRLEEQGILIDQASAVWLTKNCTVVEDKTVLAKVQSCIDDLEALQDIEAVYTGCDFELL